MRIIERSIRSVEKVVATGFAPFGKFGEMSADITGWLNVQQVEVLIRIKAEG